jgi:hypothetical protein
MNEAEVKAKFEAIRASLAEIETEIAECKRVLKGRKE